ncbi:hypothetical protein MRB53_024818 [Persea americana]|uniref:Uncharacterized protein n=1 Tax=Persea americana TaxID=3435 RepID=A0ACC2LDT8_PERAE|nr:hypothetical protein MRB53_024818 [Persea americana]
MGALAPVTHWIPQDDLLLKNAVEAGASLESLAKGAVCFSRRFTIRELQDRWHSLLYDSNVSEEASAQIVKIESSVSNLLKSDKSCNSKGKEWMPTKRKADSVRGHYYAMRKRICNEPLDTFDLDFFLPPDAHICAENDSSFREQLKLATEHSMENCVLGGPISNGFAHQEASFDIGFHASPQRARVDTAVATSVDVTTQTFHNEHAHSLVHDLPNDGAMACESLYGLAENVTPITFDKSKGENVDGNSFNHDNFRENNPEIFRENPTIFQGCSGVKELEPPQTLPANNLYETDDFEVKPLSTFDSMRNNQLNVCSSSGGNQNFSSPISDCNVSFHQLGHSSPHPTVPIWRAIDDFIAPAMEIEMNLEDKDPRMKSNSKLSAVDAKKVNPLGYNVVHSESKLNDGISGDRLNGSTTISEGDFVDLSGSLFNFADAEQFLFMDDDEDLIHRCCLDSLNSILLSSPNDVHQNDILNSCDLNTSTVLDRCHVIPDGACPGELNDIGSPLDVIHGEEQNTCSLELYMTTASQNCSSGPEELMCCTLNTEDPEIPCNDDIFPSTEVLSSCVSSALQHRTVEAASSFPPSNNEFCDKGKTGKRELSLKEKEEATSVHPVASLMVGPLPLPELGLKHPNDDDRVKNELFENASSAVASMHAGIADEDPCTVVPVTAHCVSTVKLNEHIMAVESVKHDSFDSCIDSLLEKSVQGVDDTRSLAQNIVNGRELEVDGLVTLQKHDPSHEESSVEEIGFPETITNFSTSDHEEFLCESDDDVPYFSDIEAMILDMNLGPYDQESYFTREVSRYQYVDTKKAIVRLEQGAHSYMQRTIASRGAFAVFYGRRLKHYIKKTEVSLGRATEDTNVDIDLAREGCANKISRQQAIINIEEDGSFYLKNLGKRSISVNKKEVATGQRFRLTSCCLIEIRGMTFIFEMNKSFASKWTNVAKRKCTLDKNAEVKFVLGEIS